ncbi:xanthine phosphoribosyltransferase [Kosmotoga pacifica]|uniref:xanthine phosphoribosyltransferase n=1 Tax=Kosmotoga pacifica TaxID=1330330 RepID=UPI000699BAE2|nr:xanthine phosphoribosyltransferase [Kosmotoga pacifica]
MIREVSAVERCSQLLRRLIEEEGTVLEGGILKVDSFLNHQINPVLMRSIGEAIGEYFAQVNLTKIVTVESSGIAPALATSLQLGVPTVFIRKKRPITMSNYIKGEAPSHTKGGITELFLSKEMVDSRDRVLIVDDFLASGRTIEAVADMVIKTGAELKGIVGVIEKTFEGGRKLLKTFDVPIVSLLKIRSLDGRIEFDVK